MRFSVRLSFAKPERVEEVQYYVLGRDPVMVFRDEDYMRNINMVNGPPLTKPASSGAGSGGKTQDGCALGTESAQTVWI